MIEFSPKVTLWGNPVSECVFSYFVLYLQQESELLSRLEDNGCVYSRWRRGGRRLVHYSKLFPAVSRIVLTSNLYSKAYKTSRLKSVIGLYCETKTSSAKLLGCSLLFQVLTEFWRNEQFYCFNSTFGCSSKATSPPWLSAAGFMFVCVWGERDDCTILDIHIYIYVCCILYISE